MRKKKGNSCSVINRKIILKRYGKKSKQFKDWLKKCKKKK